MWLMMPVEPDCGDQISFVHAQIVRHALKLLNSDIDSADQRQTTLLTTPAPCPACASLQAGERRMSFFLAKLLHEPSGFQYYGHPALLCFPHFQMLPHSIPSNLLQRVLTIHDSAMVSALERIGTVRSTAPGRHFRENLLTTIESSLRLTVGHSPGATILPAPDAVSGNHAFRDPIGEFVASMKREDGCAICFEVARAWREWIGWLEHAARTPQDIADLLPTCREHAWACADFCGLQLGLAVAANTLDMTLRQVRNAISLFGVPLRGKAESTLGYAWRRFRHSRALALRPPDRARTVLIELELAKLASLQWELTEYARKVRWDARPEKPGTEGMAWRNSINRFSGYLTE